MEANANGIVEKQTSIWWNDGTKDWATMKGKHARKQWIYSSKLGFAARARVSKAGEKDSRQCKSKEVWNKTTMRQPEWSHIPGM